MSGCDECEKRYRLFRLMYSLMSDEIERHYAVGVEFDPERVKLLIEARDWLSRHLPS